MQASLGLSQAFERLALLMLGAVGGLMSVGKNFLAQSSSLHRHSRTWCAWPGERGSRWNVSGYLHITSNYITVRLACAEQSRTSNRSRIVPDQRSKDMCAMARWDG